MEIARSYSRKLNLQHYGGKQYETADFFASRKIEVDDFTMSKEKIQEKSEKLYSECESDVNKSIEKFKKGIEPF